jgi:ketosteroid isomerase-like protein
MATPSVVVARSDTAASDIALNGVRSGAGETFVRAWAAAWAQPTAALLAERLLQPDARLVGPMMSSTEGIEACREELRRLRASMPDVHNEVVRWSATGELVFIELLMHGTLGGRPVRIPAVDRILLRDGRAVERVAYTDSVPLPLTLLARPSAWWRWWRSGLGTPHRPRRLAEPPPIPLAATALHRSLTAIETEEDNHSESAAAVVARFAERWAHPDADRLMELCHQDVRFHAPLMSPTVGFAACREEFRRLFLLRPDTRIEVHRWSARGNAVFIELTIHMTIGGKPLRIPGVDRLLLKDGLILERVAYADSLPVITALVSTPREWRRWWRSGIGPPRRPCRL